MMGRKAKFRKALSMPGLLAQMRRCFEGVEDEVAGRGLNLADCLMSGLAIFWLKYPSRLQFEQDARGLGESGHEPRRENLRSLFGVERAPSDVRLRERLDEVDPRELRVPFKRLFARAQRGGALAGFEWLEGRYLLIAARCIRPKAGGEVLSRALGARGLRRLTGYPDPWRKSLSRQRRA